MKGECLPTYNSQQEKPEVKVVSIQSHVQSLRERHTLGSTQSVLPEDRWRRITQEKQLLGLGF